MANQSTTLDQPMTAQQFGSIDAARAFVQSNKAGNWHLLGEDGVSSCYVIPDEGPNADINARKYGLGDKKNLRVLDTFNTGSWASLSGATQTERVINNTS